MSMVDEPLGLEEIRELDDGEREAYLEQREQELHEAAETEQVEQQAAAMEARDALLAVAEDRVPTEEIELSPDVTLEVRTAMPGKAERLLQGIDQYDSISDAVGDIVTVLCGDAGSTPADPDYAGIIMAPSEYAGRQAWHDLHDVHGSGFLMEVFEELTQPALGRMEEMRSFREE